MFDKLRRGFIRMNMLVISLLMLAAFTVVTLLVYSNAQREIGDELDILLALPGRPAGQVWAPPGQPEDQPAPPEGPEAAGAFGGAGGIPRIGFVVQHTAGGYELFQVRPFFNADELDLDAILARVEAGGPAGSFTLGEHTWTYRTGLPGGTGGSPRIAFVETSESKALLGNLVRIFAAVAVGLLVAIWFVSRWFAKRSVAPIEEAYNSQRRFVQDASHELKTPVAVIKTNLELMASHPDQSVASQQDWLNNLMAETAHMEHLTTGLLALARTEAEAPRGAGERFSLSEVVQSCVLPLEAVLYEKQLAFTTGVQPGVEMTGFRQDVERLVHILMENAIQYTPAGGAVALTLAAEKRKAVLRVENTGPGIPEADLPQVFDRFYRGDAARSRDASSYGLGLSIAQGIVQRHRGGITAQSAPGKSTVFTVTLPAH